MRRHPLTDRSPRLTGALVLAAVIAGCQSAGPTTTAPDAGIRVAVGTAPGESLAFDPDVVEIGSVVPVTVAFHNRSSLAHNLTFTDGMSAATRTIVEPGAVVEVHLVPPKAGTYHFVCTIHAEMTGQLVVAASDA